MEKIYLIKHNESLNKIAYIYNLKPENLKISNNKLCNFKYVIIEGKHDGIYLIENANYPEIVKINSLEQKLDLQANGYNICQNCQINDTVLIEKFNGKKHIVKPLETLQHIANLYCTSIEEICKNNNLSSLKLFIGQILYI